ncbi:MAG TPA: type II secretion system protein GspN, partial [Polyangia bacterium]|nr:type II secretion system protein GspN [Polyangia bacterium]
AADGKRQQPREYLIDEVVVNLGVVALLFDDLDLRVDFGGLGGEISFAYAGPMPGSDPEQAERGPRGRIRRGARGAAAVPEPGAEQQGAEEQADAEEEDDGDESELLLTIEASNIDLAMLHDLRAKLPLPLTGTLDFAVRLASRTGRFEGATGELTLRMEDVVLGAENAQIDAGGMPLTIDPIMLAAIDCRVPINEGTAEFEAFETKSNDFDLKVKGTVTLGDPLKRSRFDVYLMFRFLDGYLGKSDKAAMLISNIDQFSRDFKLAHRDDGYWGFRYRGIFGSSRFTPSKLAPGEASQKAGKRVGERQRGTKAKRGRSAAGNLPSGPAGLTGLEPPAGGGMQDLPDLMSPGRREREPEPEPEPSRVDDEPTPQPEPGSGGAADEEPNEVEASHTQEEAPENETAENEEPSGQAPGEEETEGSEGEQVGE